jgi:hypothetical protein
MMRRSVCLLVILVFGHFAWPQESPKPDSTTSKSDSSLESGEIQECTLPDMDKDEEYYVVNPTIRSMYYTYLRRGFPSPPSQLSSSQESTEENDEFLSKGRFKMYISDIFSINTRLAQAAKEVEYLQKLDPAQSANHSLQKRFSTIEKQSSRLASRLMIVLPGGMDNFPANRSMKESYLSMAQKGYLKALVQLLLNKVATFENRLCRFFFPDTHTVSLYELSVHSTPYTDLKEIQMIADALADHFPAKGFPRGYHKN